MTTTTDDGRERGPALDEGRLAEIKAREKVATPGPWDLMGNTVRFGTGEHPCSWVSLPGDMTTARFIAHARQDIPDLLAEIDRLRALVAAQGEALRTLERLGWACVSAAEAYGQRDDTHLWQEVAETARNAQWPAARPDAGAVAEGGEQC